jgi:hypothetical protein
MSLQLLSPNYMLQVQSKIIHCNINSRAHVSEDDSELTAQESCSGDLVLHGDGGEVCP